MVSAQMQEANEAKVVELLLLVVASRKCCCCTDLVDQRRLVMRTLFCGRADKFSKFEIRWLVDFGQINCNHLKARANPNRFRTPCYQVDYHCSHIAMLAGINLRS
jgi:hypothetical protein